MLIVICSKELLVAITDALKRTQTKGGSTIFYTWLPGSPEASTEFVGGFDGPNLGMA